MVSLPSSMKPLRLVFIGAAALALLLLVAVAVGFNSSFQTWLVRRELAKQPALHVTVASVAAGLKHVELKEVRIEQDGAVLTLPTVTADLPILSAGLGKKIF